MDEITIIDRINRAFAWIGIVIAFGFFLFLMPQTFLSAHSISHISPAYYYLYGRVSTIDVYIILIISIILIFASLSTIFLKLNISSSFDADINKNFYIFFSVYIMILMFSSLIIETIYPKISSSAVYKYSFGVQNFIFSVSSVFQIIFLEIIPVSIILIIYMIISKKLSVNSFLFPYKNVKPLIPVIMIIAAGISVFITNYNIYETTLIYINTLILTYIYLRFGMLRALLVSFTSSGLELAESFFGSNHVISYIIAFFLLIWAFLGLYSITMLYAKTIEERNKKMAEENSRNGNDKNIDAENNTINNINENPQNAEILRRLNSVNPEKLWVRSACSNCGGVEFKINDDFSLECVKCGNVIPADADGPYNIVINQYGNVKR
ncbi:hypothetical protein [Acidiplasma sp.]|uniref:hypothetical protein n=1 Tax=Acidiplasma sp. TaxID=1872114 RepID=UPI002586F39E|nr:hypothetical protein [Acidiplasma sp.]